MNCQSNSLCYAPDTVSCETPIYELESLNLLTLISVFEWMRAYLCHMVLGDVDQQEAQLAPVQWLYNAA